MEAIRTFIAIPISQAVQTALDQLIHQMRQNEDRIKWVNPENVHLTLKFLGNVPVSQLPKVFAAVGETCRENNAFRLITGGTGVFPSQKKPRVLWVGLNPSRDSRLYRLQSDIEAGLAEQGFPQESRTFKAHLTVGRLKTDRGPSDLVRRFIDYPFPKISLPVEEVVVMKSALTSSGPIYTVQQTFALSG